MMAVLMSRSSPSSSSSFRAGGASTRLWVRARGGAGSGGGARGAARGWDSGEAARGDSSGVRAGRDWGMGTTSVASEGGGRGAWNWGGEMLGRRAGAGGGGGGAWASFSWTSWLSFSSPVEARVWASTWRSCSRRSANRRRMTSPLCSGVPDEVAHGALERAGELERGGVAVRALARQRLEHDGVQLRGHRLVGARGRRMGARSTALTTAVGRLAVKQAHAGEALVQHHAQAEQVAARIQRLAEDLLRRHVAAGALHHAHLGAAGARPGSWRCRSRAAW